MAKRPQKRSGDLQAPALNAPQLGVTSQPVDTRVTPAENAPQAPQLLPEPAKPDMQGARDLENMGRALGDLSKTLFSYAQVSKQKRVQEKKDTRDEALRRLREGAKPFEEMQKKGELTGATPPQLKGVSIAYATYAAEQAMLDWQQDVETLRADPGYLKANGWQSHLQEIFQKRYNEFAGVVKAGGRPDAFNRAFNRLAKDAQDRIQADHARWLQGAAEDKRLEGVRGELRMTMGNFVNNADNYDLTTDAGVQKYRDDVLAQLKVSLTDGFGQTYSEDAYPTVFGKALIDLAATEDSITDIALFALTSPELGDLVNTNQEVREYYNDNIRKINDARTAGVGRTAQGRVTELSGQLEADLQTRFQDALSVEGNGKASMSSLLDGSPMGAIRTILGDSVNEVTIEMSEDGNSVVLRSRTDITKTADVNIPDMLASARQTVIGEFIDRNGGGAQAEVLAFEQFGKIPQSVDKIQAGVNALETYVTLDDPEAEARVLEPAVRAYDAWSAYNQKMHTGQLMEHAGVGQKGEVMFRAMHLLVRRGENALPPQQAAALVADRMRTLENELPGTTSGNKFAQELERRTTTLQKETGEDLILRRLAESFMFITKPEDRSAGPLITVDEAITAAQDFLDTQSFMVGGTRMFYSDTPLGIEDTQRPTRGNYTDSQVELVSGLLGGEKPAGIIVEGIESGHVFGFLTEEDIADFSENPGSYEIKAFVPTDATMTSFTIEMADGMRLGGTDGVSIAELRAYQADYALYKEWGPEGPPDPVEVKKREEVEEVLAAMDELEGINRIRAKQKARQIYTRQRNEMLDKAKAEAASKAEAEQIQRDQDNANTEEGIFTLLSLTPEGRGLLSETLSLSTPETTVLRQVAPEEFGEIPEGEVTLPPRDALTALRRLSESRLPQAESVTERKGGLPELARQIMRKEYAGTSRGGGSDLRPMLIRPDVIEAYKNLPEAAKDALGEDFAWMEDPSIPIPETLRERAVVEGTLGTAFSRAFTGPSALGRIFGSEGSTVESMVVVNMLATGDTEKEVEQVIMKRFGRVPDRFVDAGKMGDSVQNAGRRAVLVRRLLIASPQGLARLRETEARLGTSPNSIKRLINDGPFLKPDDPVFQTEGAYEAYSRLTDEERRVLGNPFSFLADPRNFFGGDLP